MAALTRAGGFACSTVACEERELAGKGWEQEGVQEVLAHPLMYSQDPPAAARYWWSMENLAFPTFGGC